MVSMKVGVLGGWLVMGMIPVIAVEDAPAFAFCISGPPSDGIRAGEAIVHVYTSLDGKIYSPDTWGNPDPRNVLIHVGSGVVPDHERMADNSVWYTGGLLSIPEEGSVLFARVFDHGTTSLASSFIDSSPLLLDGDQTSIVFYCEGVARLLDAGDDDGDGVLNSVERSLGMDPSLMDSDRDGSSDRDELIAGTDPLDADSHFAVVQVNVLMGGEVVVGWQTERKRIYTLEYSDCIDAEGRFCQVSEIKGTGDLIEATLCADAQCFGFFRVRVREMPPPE